MRDEGSHPSNTKVTVTEQSYTDGDPVPMPDGVYMAVGTSRPLTFDPCHFATTVRRA